MKIFTLGQFISLLAFLPLFVFSSCNELNTPLEAETKDNSIDYSEKIAVENGYLSFDNQETLNNYLNDLRCVNDGKSNKRVVNFLNSSLNHIDGGFVSLAKKVADLQSNANHRVDNNISSSTLSNDIAISFLGTIIPDEAIYNILDTANRVKVGDEIYQITEAGTFVYKSNTAEEFESLYQNFFEEYTTYISKEDDLVYHFDHEIKFIDTFGFLLDGEISFEEVAENLLGNETNKSSVQNRSRSETLSSGSNRINPYYTNKFNLVNHTAGAVSWVGEQINMIAGVNNPRYRDIDGRHRLKVNYYNFNYLVFQNSGFRVTFQEKVSIETTIRIGRWYTKRIVIGHFWRKAHAQEMIIGIDHFKGYTEYTTFAQPEYRSMQQVANGHSQKFANVAYNMAYHGYIKAPAGYLTGWSDDFNYFEGGIFVDFSKITEKIPPLDKIKDPTASYNWDQAVKDVNHMAYDKMVDVLKGKSTSFIYKTVSNSLNKGILLYSTTNLYPNRQYLSLQGLHKFNHTKTRNLGFGSPTGGVSISFSNSSGNFNPVGLPSSYVPNKFVVEEMYIFGAVKHNGVWKGLRIYTPKK